MHGAFCTAAGGKNTVAKAGKGRSGHAGCAEGDQRALAGNHTSGSG